MGDSLLAHYARDFRERSDHDSGPVLIPALTETGKTLELPGTLNKPNGSGPFPALILLCGSEGLTHPAPPAALQHAKWVDLVVGWGYVALGLDSHAPRGREFYDS